ncbi:MAG TPA: hypothetical protein VFJ03_02675, partial [Candidatus Limnocylindria bacterium]|nr:hypothetical protein [Candidatus Limnocylindria bacterium]
AGRERRRGAPLMAGTMPHAIFIETGLDGGLIAAYAAELPGCATFAADADEAAAGMPARVTAFTAWLRQCGEPAPAFVGDNWYEVERAAAVDDGKGLLRRAAFTLDELPPSAEELGAWMRWLELSREELAAALDEVEADPARLAAISQQDLAMATSLGADADGLPEEPIDRLYAARDLLTDALEAAGPGRDGVRRALRLAIADDLRLADVLRGAEH